MWPNGCLFIPGLSNHSSDYSLHEELLVLRVAKNGRFLFGTSERAEVFVKVSNTFLGERKCWWQFLHLEPRQKHSAQIMKFLFITWTRTDFFTGRTLAVGLEIPHVSKYILCDLANLKASWSCKHEQMVLAGVTLQPVCWKLPLEASLWRGIVHIK